MANAADQRPMSPHLQVWRWHITMLASILHRATGVILALGAIGVVLWLAAIAAGPNAYDRLMHLVPSWVIEVKLYAITAVVAFHLANGIRHLVWDFGKGFKPASANSSAFVVILIALAAPVGLWALLHYAR